MYYALAPVHLEVVSGQINESYKHNVFKGAESHFTVFVVSESFDGKNMLARHRLVSGELVNSNIQHIMSCILHTSLCKFFASKLATGSNIGFFADLIWDRNNAGSEPC